MQNLQAKSLKKSVDSHQKKEKRWKNYVKLEEYCLFIFPQVKLIEDEWFSFLTSNANTRWYNAIGVLYRPYLLNLVPWHT